jgi:hypothetical protein
MGTRKRIELNYNGTFYIGHCWNEEDQGLFAYMPPGSLWGQRERIAKKIRMQLINYQYCLCQKETISQFESPLPHMYIKSCKRTAYGTF